MSMQCKSCQSYDVELINGLLYEGHSSACVMWHLYHLGRRVSIRSLDNHREKHLGLGTVSRNHAPVVSPGWYMPRPAPVVPEGSAPELLLIRGIPGSGKSRLAREFLATHAHLETDQFFLDINGGFAVEALELRNAHDWCEGRAAAFLAFRVNVVVSNTFLNLWELYNFCVMGQKQGATIRILDVPNPWPWKKSAVGIAFPRNVPRQKFFRMRKAWQALEGVPDSWGIPVRIEHVIPPEDLPEYETMPFLCTPRVCGHYAHRFSGSRNFRGNQRFNTSKVPFAGRVEAQ